MHWQPKRYTKGPGRGDEGGNQFRRNIARGVANLGPKEHVQVASHMRRIVLFGSEGAKHFVHKDSRPASILSLFR